MDRSGVRIEIGNGSAGEAEAAAIAAAIERFAADTAPAQVVNETGMDPWLKAALVEGVDAKAAFGPGNPPGME